MNRLKSPYSNQSKIISQIKKNIKKQSQTRYVHSLALFDLPNSRQRLFADIVLHNRICKSMIKQHGGIIFEEIGDAVIGSFKSEGMAVTCALDAIHNINKYTNISTQVAIVSGTLNSNKKEHYADIVNLCNKLIKIVDHNSIIINKQSLVMVKLYLSEFEIGKHIHRIKPSSVNGWIQIKPILKQSK